MKSKMSKSEKREAVKRVIYKGETVEEVVKDLKKYKKINVHQLRDWINYRVGILTKKDRSKAVSCVLNNGEDIKEVSKRFDIPEELMVMMIKNYEKFRDIEKLQTYHEGIRRDDFKGNIFKRFTMDIGVKLSTIRFTEVIYREFCMNNSDVFEDLTKIEKFGKLHNINLNYVDKETTYNQIALNYLVIIHECFDNYLNNIYDLLKDGSKGNFKVKQDKQTILDCILDNASMSCNKNSNNYKICNYYRLVRNANIHDTNVENAPQIDTILPNKEIVRPNKFSQICYKDADLFAYAVLELGKEIYNSLNIDVEKFIESRDLYDKLELGRYDQNRSEERLLRHLEIVLPCERKEISNEVHEYVFKRKNR